MHRSWQDIVETIRPESHPTGDGFRADIFDNWRQGRTAYGGVSAALMLEGAQRKFPDLPPLRSALINFVGPVTGSPFLTAEMLRQGRNVTSVAARASVEDQVVATADFVFGQSRESKITVDFPAPDLGPPENYPPFTPDAVKPLVPVFFNNFDTRLVDGARPMMGTEGYIRTVTRHHDIQSRDGIISLLCLGDVLPPAALPLLRDMAPVSSMTWMVNVLVDAPQTTDGWWHVETRLSAAAGGYSSQVMRIWNMDGQLVVEGMQSVAIFA